MTETNKSERKTAVSINQSFSCVFLIEVFFTYFSDYTRMEFFCCRFSTQNMFGIAVSPFSLQSCSAFRIFLNFFWKWRRFSRCVWRLNIRHTNYVGQFYNVRTKEVFLYHNFAHELRYSSLSLLSFLSSIDVIYFTYLSLQFQSKYFVPFSYILFLVIVLLSSQKREVKENVIPCS